MTSAATQLRATWRASSFVLANIVTVGPYIVMEIVEAYGHWHHRLLWKSWRDVLQPLFLLGGFANIVVYVFLNHQGRRLLQQESQALIRAQSSTSSAAAETQR